MSKLKVHTESLTQAMKNNPEFLPTLMSHFQGGNTNDATVSQNSITPTVDALAPTAAVHMGPTHKKHSGAQQLTDAVHERPSDYADRIMEERMHNMMQDAGDQ